jgi:hypothetical protein
MPAAAVVVFTLSPARRPRTIAHETAGVGVEGRPEFTTRRFLRGEGAVDLTRRTVRDRRGTPYLAERRAARVTHTARTPPWTPGIARAAWLTARLPRAVRQPVRL